MNGYNILLCIIFFNFVTSLNLTSYEWTLIKNILINPSCTSEIKEKINSILFEKYKTWTVNQVYVFKKKHPHLCKNVQTNELKIYSLEALSRVIQDYKPQYPFHSYLEKYIMWNLYKGVSALQPLNRIPLYKRTSKKYLQFRKENQIKIEPLFIGFDDSWQIENKESVQNNIENYRKYEDDIEEFFIKANKINNNRDKQIFYYKFYYDLGYKIRSTVDVAKYMCLSEETIRKSINNTIKKINEK